jgi:hypothetical protein
MVDHRWLGLYPQGSFLFASYVSTVTDSHKVDLILPQELLETILASSLVSRPPPEYRRVIMSLGEILSGDFLKEYVKQGETLLPLCLRLGDVTNSVLNQGMS